MYILFCFLCVLLSFNPPSLFHLSFPAFRPCHLFEAANEIDNGSSRASVLSLKQRLHANCFMPAQKRGRVKKEEGRGAYTDGQREA